MSSTAPIEELAILPAGPADCPDLVRLIHHAFAAYRGVLVPDSGAHTETAESLAAALESGAAYRALLGGSLAGCLFLDHRPDRLYLGRLAVDPALRGRGIGMALLAAAEAHARARGLACLELGVRLVLQDNIRLFQRAGFAIIRQESHPGYEVPTYHVMEKVLG